MGFLYSDCDEEARRRITELQLSVARLHERLNAPAVQTLWVPENGDIKRKDVPVTDIIELLLKHLGVELAWNKGTPSGPKLARPAKRKAKRA